jgi:hypothetical protein
VSGSLPLADPQFWVVSAAALLALALVLRRVLKRPKATPPGTLPCANCPKPKS